MATITAAQTFDVQFHRVIWETMGDDDTGTSVELGGAPDRSIQVTGTFGGATVTVQGSNEVTPTNWATLNDVFGNPLTFTTAGLAQIAEITAHIRAITASGTSTDVDVTMVAKKTY